MLRLFFLFFLCIPAFSASKDCEKSLAQVIDGLLKSGPGDGFFYADEILPAMEAYNHRSANPQEGIEVRISAHYVCGSCGQLNFARSTALEEASCQGCGKGIDPRKEVFDLKINDRVVHHAQGVLFVGTTKDAPPIQTPIECPSCGEVTSISRRECEHCGSDVGTIAAPVKWQAPIQAAVSEAGDIEITKPVAEQSPGAKVTMPRRRWMMAAAAATGGIGAYGLWRYMSDDGIPQLPSDKLSLAKVEERMWVLSIRINRWHSETQTWKEFETLESSGLDRDTPVWPEIPAHVRSDSKAWQIQALPESFSLFVRISDGSTSVISQLSRREYDQFRAGDEIEILTSSAQQRVQKVPQERVQ